MNISERFYKLLKFIRSSNLLGMQVFNCPSLVGDYRESVYEQDGIEVLVCPYYEYVEILGISNEEFKAISTYDGVSNHIKDHL